MLRLEAGAIVETQGEKSSFLDKINCIALVKMTRGKDIASERKQRGYPYGTKTEENQEGEKLE
jgi:hypothetical protein